MQCLFEPIILIFYLLLPKLTKALNDENEGTLDEYILFFFYFWFTSRVSHDLQLMRASIAFICVCLIESII